MELRQLEYLIAVTEEASFTRAAERMHVAQPGVSAQIRRLERELGQRLLDRSGAPRPTAAGAVVLPYARAALAAVAGARQAVDELTGLLRGHLTIGTPGQSLSPRPDVAALLAGYHREHPGVRISLAVGTSTELLAAVRAGRYDAAFVALSGPAPRDVATEVITEEPMLAVVPPADPLAARAEITLAELVERELISLPVGTGVRTSLDDACAAAGLTPRIRFEAPDPGTLAELATHGLGTAIVPRPIAAERAGELHALRITAPELSARIVLAWRTGAPLSPAVHELIRRVRRQLSVQGKTVDQPAGTGSGGGGPT